MCTCSADKTPKQSKTRTFVPTMAHFPTSTRCRFDPTPRRGCPTNSIVQCAWLFVSLFSSGASGSCWLRWNFLNVYLSPPPTQFSFFSLFQTPHDVATPPSYLRCCPPTPIAPMDREVEKLRHGEIKKSVVWIFMDGNLITHQFKKQNILMWAGFPKWFKPLYMLIGSSRYSGINTCTVTHFCSSPPHVYVSLWGQNTSVCVAAMNGFATDLWIVQAENLVETMQ